MKKIIMFLFIFSFFIFNNNFVFSEIEQKVPQTKINLPTAELPETIKEAEEIGIDFLNFLPGEMKKGWNNALSIWSNMYKYSFDLFNKYLKNHLISISYKTQKTLKNKIKETHGNLKKELIQEQQEIKKSAKQQSGKVTKSLWEIVKEKVGLKKK